MTVHCCAGQTAALGPAAVCGYVQAQHMHGFSHLEALLVVHEDEDPLGAERVDATAYGVDAVPRVRDHVHVVQVRRQTDRCACCAATSGAVSPAACSPTLFSFAISLHDTGEHRNAHALGEIAWPAWQVTGGAALLVQNLHHRQRHGEWRLPSGAPTYAHDPGRQAEAHLWLRPSPISADPPLRCYCQRRCDWALPPMAPRLPGFGDR